MLRSASDWLRILIACGVRATTSARWSEVFARVVHQKSFSAADAELDDFLGQILHESAMLERIEEGFSYSAERLCSVWPSRFPTLADAAPYARNPEKLANKVYGGRLGNTAPGDGYKYRGRGLVQVTGYANYAAVAEALRIDLIGSPELLSDPDIALAASVAWWERKIPDSAMGNIVRVTKLVNGGVHGLEDRRKLSALARRALA